MSRNRSQAATLAVLFLVAAGSTVALSGAATAQSQVTLTVTVVDQDGDPLSNIDISARWDGGGPVNETTRANGQALVDVPEGATVQIAVHDDEYVRNVPLTVEDASARSVEVDVSPAATATVSVVGSDGSPVEDARVRLFTDGNYVTDQRTGSDGTVTSPPIEVGTYTVIATKAGFFRNMTRATFVGENETSITLAEGSVLVTFSVVDEHFDPPEPMREARIAVGDVGSVQTLSDGEATISVPVNDRYDVRITKDGYQTFEQRLAIQESETTVNVSISRTPRIDLTPANERVVVGESVALTVTDEYGEAVPNATVSRGEEMVGTTDAAGDITATVPTAGNVTFSAENGSLRTTVTVEGVQPGGADTPTETATATPTEQATTDSTGVAGPGFTPAAALVALALAVAFLARRR
ncbi:carboxypeptidase-like regulatory domain-containing protein [Halomicroarcula sp. GCM10025817]|uniref:carboxypeptidase-like regulatory domain-containing protein n=1 Tax=Haloarcula TaxID=2237 RepID=UPI0023E865DA|nr:carboxypeptidase-like regulatory domain-containing protein [Halomicroarcula sp. SYNS111]